MREYVITIKDRPYHVVIKKMQTDTAVVEVNGSEYVVGVERTFKRHVQPLEVKPVRKQTQPEQTVSPSPLPGKTVAGNEVVAPLPGLILSVQVKKGDRVSAGQTLLKMEAMKMENEIKAHRSGTVAGILVKEGDSVLENAPLVMLGE